MFEDRLIGPPGSLSITGDLSRQRALSPVARSWTSSSRVFYDPSLRRHPSPSPPPPLQSQGLRPILESRHLPARDVCLQFRLSRPKTRLPPSPSARFLLSQSFFRISNCSSCPASALSSVLRESHLFATIKIDALHKIRFDF